MLLIRLYSSSFSQPRPSPNRLFNFKHGYQQQPLNHLLDDLSVWSSNGTGVAQGPVARDQRAKRPTKAIPFVGGLYMFLLLSRVYASSGRALCIVAIH